MCATGPRSILICAALVAAISMTLVVGCGGGGDDGPFGGTITGQTIDAASNLGLGGVLITVATTSGQRSALSTTPNGTFAIENVPPGTYTSLHVTPDVTLYGVGSDFDVATTIVVTEGGTTALAGRILIVEDGPPSAP